MSPRRITVPKIDMICLVSHILFEIVLEHVCLLSVECSGNN